jgi:hypothetical protein
MYIEYMLSKFDLLDVISDSYTTEQVKATETFDAS